jgi:hypothetical protein
VCALVRRNAGGADQLAPDIDLALEKSASIRERSDVGLFLIIGLRAARDTRHIDCLPVSLIV